MEVKKIEVFPTTLMAVKCEQNLDVEKLVEDIDYAIEEGKIIQSNEDSMNIKHQSWAMIFKHEINDWRKDTEHTEWQKVNQSFFDACEQYILNNELMGEKFFNTHVPAHTRGWFYRSDAETFAEQGAAMHNHNPSFLSGVFYLKTNGGGGTRFFDPRVWDFNRETADVHALDGYWVIFPGNLMHETMGTTADDPRYVIAADLYVVAK